MTPEEFERLKEEEKEHLRAIKKLQATARRLRATRSVQKALSQMLHGAKTTLDTHEEMIYRLALETARHEARYEIATENLPEENLDAFDEDTSQAALDEYAEQQAEERARKLVEQMKRAGQPSAPSDPDESRADQSTSSESTKDSPPSESPPEKTIGRM